MKLFQGLIGDMFHRTNSGLLKYLQNACNNVVTFYHYHRHLLPYQISHQILANKIVLKKNR